MSQKNILLETGTNEFEILKFNIGNNLFGINVAKVHQIIEKPHSAIVPNAHPCIEGVFQLRSKVIPLIDLARYLHLPASENSKTDRVIVTEFNNTFTAFHVHSHASIQRISWENIETPETVTDVHHGVVTGVVRSDDEIIILLDFEKIIFDIAPHRELEETNNDRLKHPVRNDKVIYLAEDSETLRIAVMDTLTQAGYNNILIFKNGKEALDYISDPNSKKPDLVITDIEMPQVDGHLLITKLRQMDDYKQLPIIIFSSFINDATYKKGITVGATEQISKPQLLNLVSILDHYLINN